MLSTTIRAVLAEEELPSLTSEYQLYLLKDTEGRVLYVGRSVHPLVRMQEHLGLTWRGGEDQVGQLIRQQAPASDEWSLFLLTVEECRSGVEQWMARVGPAALEAWLRAGGVYEVTIAEKALIHRYRPPLNRTDNAHPTALPEKYRMKPTETSATYLRQKRPSTSELE